jgi:hypothetical protein
MMNPLHSLFHWWTTRPWNTWLDSTNKLTQILVVVGGGLAALRKFGTSVELSVTGKPFQSRGIRYLIVTARLKNNGVMKLHLLQPGTAMIISVLEDTATSEMPQVSWSKLAVLPVFEHQRIIPSETLQEVITLKVPSDRVAVQLHLRAEAKTPVYFRFKVAWNSKSIVELPEVPKSDSPPPA